jgi:phosphoribosylformylglycinamidine synthase
MSCDSFKLGGSAFAQSLNKVGKEAPTVKCAKYFAQAFAAIQKLTERNLVAAQHDVSAGGLITTLLEMCFANTKGGLIIDIDNFEEQDIIKILFAENPAVVLQIEDTKWAAAQEVLAKFDVKFIELGTPQDARVIELFKGDDSRALFIDHLRDLWYKSSWLLDMQQSGEKCATLRYENYRKQPIKYTIPAAFKGRLADYGLMQKREGRSGVKAAIIREKGVNGDREMAYSLYLAGFDVKDVHMTDLTSGRETLEDVNMIVFCGGFSNSDVLGSAKGWAGGFLYNEKAKKALENFYARPDTLSLGVCNGCQLMMELGLICPEHKVHPKMLHNDSHKFESNFISVVVPKNNSVMLGSLAGEKLGIWVAHGEGKFQLPEALSEYNIALKYAYAEFPGNPNGSRGAVAGIASKDGRHLAMMPHLERAIFPWQCAYYPEARRNQEITPWLTAFVNAKEWILKNRK